MALADQRAKSAKMAKDLIARGFYHGRRQSSPYPNSGGMTFRLTDVGSAAYRRRQGTRSMIR